MTKREKENLLTEDEARDVLKSAIGGTPLRAWAADAEVDPGHVCGARNGTKSMGGSIASAIGLERVSMFKKVRPKT